MADDHKSRSSRRSTKEETTESSRDGRHHRRRHHHRDSNEASSHRSRGTRQVIQIDETLDRRGRTDSIFVTVTEEPLPRRRHGASRRHSRESMSSRQPQPEPEPEPEPAPELDPEPHLRQPPRSHPPSSRVPSSRPPGSRPPRSNSTRQESGQLVAFREEPADDQINFSEAPSSAAPPRQRAQDDEEHPSRGHLVSESGYTGTSHDTVTQNDATPHAPIEPLPTGWDDWDMFRDNSAPTGPAGPVFGPDYTNLPSRFDTVHRSLQPNDADLGMFQAYPAPTGPASPVFGPDYTNLPARFDTVHRSPRPNGANQFNTAYGPQHYPNHPNPWGLVWGQQRPPLHLSQMGMAHGQHQQGNPPVQWTTPHGPHHLGYGTQPNQWGWGVHRSNEQQLANSLGMGPQGYTAETRDRIHTWTRNIPDPAEDAGSDGASSTTLFSTGHAGHAR